jgi:hypothetical protein
MDWPLKKSERKHEQAENMWTSGNSFISEKKQ